MRVSASAGPAALPCALLPWPAPPASIAIYWGKCRRHFPQGEVSSPGGGSAPPRQRGVGEVTSPGGERVPSGSGAGEVTSPGGGSAPPAAAEGGGGVRGKALIPSDDGGDEGEVPPAVAEGGGSTGEGFFPQIMGWGGGGGGGGEVPPAATAAR